MSAPTIDADNGFDLFRLSRAKEVVDISPNTLRKFNGDGLQFYRRGSAVFVSKADLSMFLRAPTRKGQLK